MDARPDELERYRRRLRVRHQTLRRLGVTNLRCICGEDDPVCFEADHIYRREYDPSCWGICCNCHRKRTARGWSEHPKVGVQSGNPFERTGHLLLGASDYLEFIVGHLREAAELQLNFATRNTESKS